jgi:hypothetical protein
MKWGVRRYQNPDGTLTELGKKRLKKDLGRVRNSYSSGGSNFKERRRNNRLRNNPVIKAEGEKLSVAWKNLKEAYDARDKDMINYIGDDKSIKKDFKRYFYEVDDDVKSEILGDPNISGKNYSQKVDSLVKEYMGDDNLRNALANSTYMFYRIKDNPKSGKLEEERANAWKNYNDEVNKAADRIMKEVGDVEIHILFDDDFPDNEENRKEAQRLENSQARYSVMDLLREHSRREQ